MFLQKRFKKNIEEEKARIAENTHSEPLAAN